MENKNTTPITEEVLSLIPEFKRGPESVSYYIHELDADHGVSVIFNMTEDFPVTVLIKNGNKLTRMEGQLTMEGLQNDLDENGFHLRVAGIARDEDPLTKELIFENALWSSGVRRYFPDQSMDVNLWDSADVVPGEHRHEFREGWWPEEGWFLEVDHSVIYGLKTVGQLRAALSIFGVHIPIMRPSYIAEEDNDEI